MTKEEIINKNTGLTIDDDMYLIQTHIEYVMFDSEIETSYNDEIIGNIYENPNLLK